MLDMRVGRGSGGWQAQIGFSLHGRASWTNAPVDTAEHPGSNHRALFMRLCWATQRRVTRQQTFTGCYNAHISCALMRADGVLTGWRNRAQVAFWWWRADKEAASNSRPRANPSTVMPRVMRVLLCAATTLLLVDRAAHGAGTLARTARP